MRLDCWLHYPRNLVEWVGIEPTCLAATGLQPAALPLEHPLHYFLKPQRLFFSELILLPSKTVESNIVKFLKCTLR
jgi:hypothetical protein